MSRARQALSAAPAAFPTFEDAGDGSDEAIMAASVSCGTDFGQIYDRHAQAILGYLTRRVGSQHSADLLSETFLAAFESRGRYRPEGGTVRAWLLGIATNQVRRRARAEAAYLRTLDRHRGMALGTTGTSPEQVDSTGPPAIAQAQAARDSADLGHALADLSPQDRDLLLLLAWGGLTYAELSTALDLPVGTVRSRLSRIRKRLQPHLSDLRPTDSEASP